MYRFVLRIFALYCLIYPSSIFGSDGIPQPVDWVSPLPGVEGSDFDIKEITHLIGEDGQFIYRREPARVKCWSKGEEKIFPGGVIVTSMKVIDAPLEKVRATILDYTLTDEIQSQHINVKTVSKKGNHTLYSYRQIYKMGVITLKADFIVQQTLEKDGSISTLLHEGDLDAQVQRWEFVPLDGNRTLLVLTFWAAYDTARFAFKVLMSCMSESYLFAPVMFCSMYLEQFGDYIERETIESKTDSRNILSKPKIPIYTEELSASGRKLIESFVAKGTIFLRTYQRAYVEKKPIEIPVMTVFEKLDVPVQKAATIISDISNLPDAIPIIKSVRKKNNDGSLIRINYNMGKFPIYLPLFIQQRYFDVEKTSLYWENDDKKGAYYPYLGAYEWDRLDPGYTDGKASTLYIYTHALKIGPNANIFIRTFNKLMPDAGNLQLLVSASIIVECRKRWIEQNYIDILHKQKSHL